MSRPDGKFRHESLQDRKTIKTLLAALTKGIRAGEITLSRLRRREDDRRAPRPASHHCELVERGNERRRFRNRA